jgi:hypothetical protein
MEKVFINGDVQFHSFCSELKCVLWNIREGVICKGSSQKVSCGFKSGCMVATNVHNYALQEICANLHGPEMSHEES